MTRLKHPSLTRVYDFGQDTNGDCYIVMEWVSGISLRKFLNQKIILTENCQSLTIFYDK